MPRLLIFDGLKENEHTFYDDAKTGATVQVYPGSQIPARDVLDPEHYVAQGYARLEGEEDGTDGRLDRLMAQLRSVLAELAPLPGPSRSWKLADMLEQAQAIEADDVASREAFAAAEAAAVHTSIEDIHAADSAQDEAGGGTPEVAPA